jgi:hypothetical protein
MIIALTEPKPRFMLCLLSPHVKVGICSPRKGENSPLPLVVFFRPRFLIGTGLIRAKFIMVDCLRGLYESARSFACTANLTQSTAQCFAANGGGLFTLQRNTAMSHHQTAPNEQAPIVLNPRTLAQAMQWLERAENNAGNLAIQFSEHESSLKFTEIENQIAQVYHLLSRVIMSGVKAPLPTQTEPKPQATTKPQRQTTGYGLAVDGRGYDCRVLLDRDGDYLMVSQHCSKPHGHRQVCIKCGYDRFNDGVHYVKCPECEAAVNYHCRYVAIAGGV